MKIVCQKNMAVEMPERVERPRGRPPQDYVWDPERGGMYILTRAHCSTEMHKKLFFARGKPPSSEGATGILQRGFARAVSVDT